MNKEESIVIHQVENGYIVTDYLQAHQIETTTARNERVFQSHEELIRFLQNHFTFRNDSILEDEPYKDAIKKGDKQVIRLDES